MEDRAAAVRGAAAGVLGDGRARERRLGGLAARAAGLAAGLYPTLSRHGSGRGRALPRQRSALLVAATSALYRAAMHGQAQAFGRARAIGAAKSVSLKKTDSVRFKISFEKVLKLKKNQMF